MSIEYICRTPALLSLFEGFITWLFSNIPLVVLIFVHVLNTKGEHFNWPTIVSVTSNNWNPTEVFVYVAAIIAPALWVMFYHWRARRHATLYAILLVLQAGVIIFSAIIYSQSKYTKIPNDDFVQFFSILAYIGALVIWYITLIYQKILTNPSFSQPESGRKIRNEL